MTNPNLQKAVETALCEHTAPALALGFLRYEAMRVLSVSALQKLRVRNMAGERWDDMIDELITKQP